jgi:hypothetical protein
MRPEDLIYSKKYRHPDFNFDLYFHDKRNNIPQYDGTAYIFCKKHTGNWVFLQYEEIEKLTEAREPIKKETVSYSFVDLNLKPSERNEDVITELFIKFSRKSLKQLMFSNVSCEEKAIFKITTNCIELTQEQINEELKKEESN